MELNKDETIYLNTLLKLLKDEALNGKKVNSYNFDKSDYQKIDSIQNKLATEINKKYRHGE